MLGVEHLAASDVASMMMIQCESDSWKLLDPRSECETIFLQLQFNENFSTVRTTNMKIEWTFFFFFFLTLLSKFVIELRAR